MNSRRLKVEPLEECFGRPITKTMIRLKGRWLKQAGFDTGHHIEVIYQRPGLLILRDVSVDVTAQSA